MEKSDLKTDNCYKLVIDSHLFKNNENIPDICCCEGQNLFPTLEIKKIPIETQTLAIIMEDSDTKKDISIHLIAWNIPVTCEEAIINEDILKKSEKGINDFGVRRWLGPCPPEGEKIHHYIFKIYGLDRKIHLSSNSTKSDLLEKIDKNKLLVCYGNIVGIYER